MTSEMDRQNARAARILRRFARYVSEASELSQAKKTIRKQRIQIEVLTVQLAAERVVVDQFRAARDRHADGANLDEPAIARRNPDAHKAIKARVGWRLLAKNGKGRKS